MGGSLGIWARGYNSSFLRNLWSQISSWSCKTSSLVRKEICEHGSTLEIMCSLLCFCISDLSWVPTFSGDQSI